MAHADVMRYTEYMNIIDILEKIKEYDIWPEAFEEGASIWDDEYISRNMLKAHLDESHDKASYRKKLRRKIAENIIKRCNLNEGDSVLDLGCGPGLYAKEFAKRGIKYTGIDISNQSLGYAMSHKGEYSSQISYIKGDYTQYQFEKKYDCAVMIWCDFGAISPKKRDGMLKSIKGALKPGGYFCFDVYSVDAIYEKDSSSWRVEEGGFWQEGLYAVLERKRYYETAGVRLHSALVASEKGIKNYRIWDKRYGKAELTKVLKDVGYNILSIKKGGLSKTQKDMFGVFLKS